jgi:hypothetical protein
MINVAILYIGHPRFKDLSMLNHKKLIDTISMDFKVTIYDFTQPILNRSDCLFTSSGGIQLWDLYTSVDKIKEDVIIKIRTDLFFTDSSIITIVSELKQIAYNQIDVSFLGLGVLSEHVDSELYKEKFYSYTYQKTGKVLDWIVIFDKKFISHKNFVFEQLTSGKSSRNGSGNYTWKLIVKSPLDTNVVCCHTALIRKLYKNEDFIFKNVVLDMFELSLPQHPSIITFFKENLCN